MAVDPRRFLLNTDYPMDQIAGFMQGNFTIANGALQTIDIPHGLGFTPLPIGSWSYDAGFSTSYPAITDLNGNGARPNMGISANGTNLSITVSNYTGSSKTIYWRAFFLIPSNVDPDVAPTAVNSLPFTFSSDYNYTKLLKEGYVTSSTTISHDLGYRPQVACWFQNSGGYVAQMNVSDSRPGLSSSVEVTTTGLAIFLDGFTPGMHYRIYADD